METDLPASGNHLFQYLKHPFHLKQFFRLLEIYLKRIVYYSWWQRIFCLLVMVFFHSDFYGNHYCNQTEAIILKKILFLLLYRKPFSSIFFQILTQTEVAFRFSEIAFLRESFILVSGNGFSINCKLCAFICNFFLLVDAMFEVRYKSVFFILETDFLTSASWKRIFCLAFFYSDQVETNIQIKVKPLFIE